jgi:hypothetical protein
MAFTIKQNDTSPSLEATLKDANLTAISLVGASVKFHMKSFDGVVKINQAMTRYLEILILLVLTLLSFRLLTLIAR